MASIHAMRTPVEENLLSQLKQLGSANDNASRQLALLKFEDTGLPHKRVEEWKYTDLRAAWREALPVAEKPSAHDIEAARKLAGCLPAGECVTISFVNGHILDLPVLPQGVTATRLENDMAQAGKALAYCHDPVATLNTALVQSGLVLDFTASVDQLIHLDLRFTGTPSLSAPRIIVKLNAGVEASLLETLQSDAGAYVCNEVVEIILGDHAKLNHYRLQEQNVQAIQLTTLAAVLGSKSTYDCFTFENGGAMVRTQTFIRQNGEHAQINLSGVSLLKDRQHADTTLVTDHAMPNGASRELFKLVMTGQSRGVFQGKVIVQPDAQKTDGQMNARGLLLSDDAEFYAKPELEIYADDVLCAHGATAGALDDDLLFYLRARGIDESGAKALLVAAFIGEAIETVENEQLRGMFMMRASSWLAENLK